MSKREKTMTPEERARKLAINAAAYFHGKHPDDFGGALDDMEFVDNFASDVEAHFIIIRTEARAEALKEPSMTTNQKRRTTMNLDDLTIGEAKQLAAMFGGAGAPVNDSVFSTAGAKMPVIVTTDKRGVMFGYTTNHAARPIILTQARMCLYWSADVGGVFGLGEIGPTTGCKISATLPSIILDGVTAVMTVDAKAEAAWNSAKVQGR